MNSSSRLISALLTACFALSLFSVMPARAAGPVVENVEPVSVTFAEMGFDGRTFDGPYSMAGFAFFLPDEWQPRSGSSINLKYTVRMPDSEKSKAVSTGGYSYLFIHMNYTQLAYIPLKASGDYELKIPISLWVAPPLANGSNEIEFVFKNDIACTYDNGISVYVKPESTVNIQPLQQPTAPKLTTLPRPFFYENSVIANFHTTMVLPDNPTAGELQAAMAVAAGLGSMADDTADLGLVTEKNLTDSIKKNDHLIFVGKSLSLPVLRELTLLTPMNPYTGFLSESIGKTDGVIQINNSPWNPARAALIISGETDEAVVKAGQSLRTKVVTESGYYGLALVKKLPAAVPSTPTPTPDPAAVSYDRTFKEMGYQDAVVSGIGSFSLDYYFIFPDKQPVGKGSYINFSLTPSEGINLRDSLIYVYLNDNPVGNIFPIRETQVKNNERIEIPASQIRPGKNHLQISLDLNADDLCDNYVNNYGNLGRDMWKMTIHNDSLIHIPYGTGEEGDEDISLSAGLGQYGAELAYDPSMNNLAFILPPAEPSAWEAAARVAFRLGNSSKILKVEKGPVMLHLFLQDGDLSGAENYDVVFAGKDPEIDMSAGGSSSDLEADPAIKSYDSPVTYRMLPGVSIGKVGLGDSTWNAEHRMLSLSGSDNGGLKLAADALMLQKYQGFLVGSSIMTNGVQVVFDKP